MKSLLFSHNSIKMSVFFKKRFIIMTIITRINALKISFSTINKNKEKLNSYIPFIFLYCFLNNTSAQRFWIFLGNSSKRYSTVTLVKFLWVVDAFIIVHGINVELVIWGYVLIVPLIQRNNTYQCENVAY